MRVRVLPCAGLSGTIAAPPSKNYTARYLLAAALAEGESLVVNPAANDDSLVMQGCLAALGAEIRPSGRDLIVRGFGAHPRSRADLEVGNAGAVLRFLLAIAALGEEIAFRTPYPASLGQRPNGDLLQALETLGVSTESQAGGRLPIVIRGGRPSGGQVSLSGMTSSQFLSALLFLAPLLTRGLRVRIDDGLRSGPAVRTTIEVLCQAGIVVSADWERLTFHVPGGQAYRSGRFVVNGDYPAALSIMAAASLLPGEVEVTGLFPDCQGERAAVQELAAMGVAVTRGPDWIRVAGGRPLRAISFDGDQAIDAVLSLAAVAAFADGESVFRNVGHLRHKESDRLGDFAREMEKAGPIAQPLEECLIVKGQPEGIEGGVTVSSHQDHRLVMALTAVGLRARKGLVIDGAEHVSKSYPEFFPHLAHLGAIVEGDG